MRKLKFRVWDKNLNRYDIHAMTLCLDDDGNLFIPGYDNAKRYIIEQFTSLCDRNGKEIYEGDIVICKARNDKEDKRRIGQNYISEVFWDVDGWFVHDSPLCDSPLGMFDNTPSRRPIASIEVIGNIHENGDLLKMKKVEKL